MNYLFMQIRIRRQFLIDIIIRPNRYINFIFFKHHNTNIHAVLQNKRFFMCMDFIILFKTITTRFDFMYLSLYTLHWNMLSAFNIYNTIKKNKSAFYLYFKYAGVLWKVFPLWTRTVQLFANPNPVIRFTTNLV